MNNLQSAVEKSGLSEEEVTERALKLWNELFDLEKDGWKFVMNHPSKGTIPVFSFELIKDDTQEIVNTTETIVNNPEKIIKGLRLDHYINCDSFPPEAGKELANYLIDNNVDMSLTSIDATRVPASTLISALYISFFEEIENKAPEKLNDALNMKWQFDYEFQYQMLEMIKNRVQ